ncbi:MAG TPA: 6-phosphogluconolactonase [Candidatus Binataceae bacterium]|jgi:6-phosphogluconolactonase|nr:6-phosphogluconolactonase [Candidatus Binataceae bacterium]
MAKPQIIVLDDSQALFVRAAEEIVHVSGEAICTHGQFALALTGGNTPADVYSLIATRFHLSVDWNAVHLFWGDERCVPPDDPDSNYGMANRIMLSKLSLDPGQIHRMRGEADPEIAASEYENELRNFFSLNEGEFPRFDLILLGLGDNVHIASLFPGSPALHETRRLAVAVEVDAPQRKRITLTPPVLNNAARVMFIVSGKNKAEAVKLALEGPRNPDKYPAQIIDANQGEVMWLLDRPAASLLSSSVAE